MINLNTNKTSTVKKFLQGQNIEAIKAEIKKLEQQLKVQMEHPPKGCDTVDWGYYTIQMDRIQNKIKQLREIVPVDRTNLEEVMMAKPMDYFQPSQADNIKGVGMTFLPNVPTDPKELQKVTYTAVPIFTNARTMEEMIRIGKRDGINIEMPKFADNKEYSPAIKAIWEQRPLDDRKGWFVIDKPAVAIKYGPIPANDPYVCQEWALKNKDANGNIIDTAVVANAPKTQKTQAVEILSKSYVHEDGRRITQNDMNNWNGFKVHKDKDAKLYAAAFDEEKDLTSLEGPIRQQVTMGDVEGYVYNGFKDLKKQITKDKIVQDPDNKNSQQFIDLIKSGEDEEAINKLIQITKETL